MITNQRKLTVGRSITVWLVGQFELNYYTHIFFLGQMQPCSTGDQSNSVLPHSSLNKQIVEIFDSIHSNKGNDVII